jgi:O-antigen/teichoic acid export membrane protein
MPSEPMTPDTADVVPDGRSAGREAGERAAKNTAVRAVGEIIGKFGSLVLFGVLARKVGDARLGVFVFALAWGEVAMTPVGLGIDQYVLRRVAADRDSLDSYFWNAMTLKLTRGLPVVLGSIVLVHLLGYSRETELTVSIITAGLLFDTMARTPMNVFNSFERGELVALGIVAQRTVAALLGLAVLFAGFGVVAVAITYSLGAVVRFALSMSLLRSRLRWPRWVRPADVRLEIRRKSLTFTAQDIFGLVLARADVLLLSALATDAVVGQYGSAYRLFEATTFINVALAGAFTAMYTYLGHDTTPTLGSVFQRSIKLALALLLPIGVALGLLADPLCRAFFGDQFAAAADPLRLLAPVVVLFGVMVLCSVLVLSRSRPRRMVYTVAVASVVNIGLNFALIPSLEENGAALAMLVSMVVYATIAFALAAAEVGRINWVSMLAAPGLAAVLMAVPLLLLSGLWPVALVAGGAVYLATYAAVDRVVDPEDLRFVVDLVKRRLPSGRRTAESTPA